MRDLAQLGEDRLDRRLGFAHGEAALDFQLAQRGDSALEVGAGDGIGRAAGPRRVEQRGAGPEPAREPASCADVGLARLADRRADEHALGLARPAAGQDQRRRDALDEILAEPGALPPAPARLHLAGADDHEIVGGLALLGRDLLGRVAAAHAHGGVLQARLRRAGGQRVAQRVLAARVGGDAENGDDAVDRLGERPRELEGGRKASSLVADEQARRGLPQDVPGLEDDPGIFAGRLRVRRHGDVEQDVLLAERQRGRHLANAPERREAHARPAHRARERLVHDLPASERRDVPRGLDGAQRHLLGADQDAHAVALVVRHVGRDRQRQRAERDAVIAAASDEHGAGAEERGDVQRARPFVETVGGVDLEQAPAVHDADAVAELEGLLLVVGDEDRRDAQGLLDLLQALAQLRADLDVERAERLVEQQHPGPVRERPRERHALLLAARELALVAVAEPAQADEVEQLFAPLAALGLLHAADAQAELDVARHRHVPEDRVVLEDEPHVALLRREVRDVAARDVDRPLVRQHEPRDHAQERALAAARGAEQHEELAGLDLEADAVHRGLVGVPLRDVLDGDRHGVSAPAAPCSAAGRRR